MARRTRYSREFRERAVALVFEQVEQYSSQWEAICARRQAVTRRRPPSGE
jgi:transposase